MAVAALNSPENVQRYLTKEIEIQTVTHKDILEIGEKLLKQRETVQYEVFQEDLAEHDEELRRGFLEEQIELLKSIDDKHKKEIEEVKRQSLFEQNDALKEEAKRVEDVMNKVAKKLVSEQVLEGQKKLDEALEIARERMTIVKLKAVNEARIEEKAIFAQESAVVTVQHEENIRQVRQEWEAKLKEEKSNCERLIIEALEKQKKELKNEFEVELNQELFKAAKKHREEIAIMQSICIDEKSQKGRIQKRIENLENKLNGANEYIDKILSAFQCFVDSTPGFSKGQADFILTGLIPQKAKENLSFEKNISASGSLKVCSKNI